MIKIISDSTCDLSPELLERYNISILPLHVILDKDDYLDSVSITPDEIYDWADEHRTTPKTSAPSIEEAVNMFRPFIELGDEIIAFTVSSQMSASYNVMKLAAEELDATDRIHVVDSANLSTGIGLLILEAATMAAEGRSALDITSRMEALKPQVRSSFVVDTLTYLHRGGRCSAVTALAGGVLKLHPMIIVEDGKMTVGKKYRGRTNVSHPLYVNDLKEALLNSKKDHVFITHSGCNEDIIKNVYEYLEKLDYFEEIHVTRAGAVISSHCGYGTLGVLFISNS